MKTCVKCKQDKSDDAFRLRTKRTGEKYLAPTCRTCHQAINDHWRRRNPERVRCYNKKQRSNNLERDRRAAIESHFRRKFGLTIEQRDEMLAAQGGACPICGTTTPGGKGWCVDHNHKTGKIRAVVCSACNVGLGHFNDCPERLRNAADYLEVHNGADYTNDDRSQSTKALCVVV